MKACTTKNQTRSEADQGVMLQAIKDLCTYRIVKKVADGGMGSVYQAIQDGVNGFQKTVALKTLLPKLSDNQKFVDMFIQEAKLVANLVHENIVQIYQLGKTPEGYYFVMEYVHGLSLHEFIHFHVNVAKQPIPEKLAIFIASRIARGLSYAHSRTDTFNRPLNIVHRDVCPNNIMVTTEGLPKLTDFGIAMVSADVLGGRQQLVGKLTYMPPQQALREPVDFRADIFSLGAVLFEMLSGQRIRNGADEEAFKKLAESGHVDWDKLPADLNPDVLELLHGCMEVNPNDRYAATADVAKGLEYIIYKDGYGPTIQTLEAYLHQQFPYLYRIQNNILTSSDEFDMANTLGKKDVTATILLDDQQ